MERRELPILECWWTKKPDHFLPVQFCQEWAYLFCSREQSPRSCSGKYYNYRIHAGVDTLLYGPQSRLHPISQLCTFRLSTWLGKLNKLHRTQSSTECRFQGNSPSSWELRHCLAAGIHSLGTQSKRRNSPPPQMLKFLVSAVCVWSEQLCSLQHKCLGNWESNQIKFNPKS